MKKSRGKKGMYLIYPDNGIGLVEDNKWEESLYKYPDGLIGQIRLKLKEHLPDLNEKFNSNSRYFGYYVKDDKDRVYIYVQKQRVVIDLDISPDDYIPALENNGFSVKPRKNFQYYNGWLTGWQVPHSIDIKKITKWLLMALNQ
jgi:hypothetical protein